MKTIGTTLAVLAVAALAAPSAHAEGVIARWRSASASETLRRLEWRLRGIEMRSEAQNHGGAMSMVTAPLQGPDEVSVWEVKQVQKRMAQLTDELTKLRNEPALAAPLYQRVAQLKIPVLSVPLDTQKRWWGGEGVSRDSMAALKAAKKLGRTYSTLFELAKANGVTLPELTPQLAVRKPEMRFADKELHGVEGVRWQITH
jgi:hypothetical protein